MSPRYDIVRRGWAVAALSMVVVLLAVTGCSGDAAIEPDPPPVPGEASPETVSEEELRACPVGDAAWATAIASAEREGSFESLGALALELAANCPERWEPAWTAGECLLRPGLRERSLDLLRASREPLREAHRRAVLSGDRVGVARTTNRLGWIAFAVDREFAPAEDLLRNSVGAAVEAQRTDLAAYANSNLAGLLLQQGRLAEGLVVLQQAIDSLTASGLDVAARQASYNRAVLLYQLGNLAEAGEILTRLYAEAEATGEASLLANVSLVTGHVHQSQNESELARDWYSRVGEASPQAAAAAQLGLGRIGLRERDLEAATMHLDATIIQEVDPGLALLARVFRAEVELRAGRPSEARQRLAPVIEQADADGIKEVAYLARLILGKAWLLESPGETGEAIRQFNDAVELIESQGAGLAVSEAGIAYLRERAEPFADLAWTLATRSGPHPFHRIQTIVEQAHARALRRMLRDQDAATPPTEEPLRLLNLLPDGLLLLDYLIGEDRGVVVVIGNGRQHALPTVGWNELREPLLRYRQALRRPLVSAEARLDPMADLARSLPEARELRRLLLGPVQDSVDSANRILIVPDQDLALLPFAALPLDGDGPPRFLGEEKEIAIMPMAGVPPGWSSSRSPVLLAGDPLPDPEGRFGRLPLAADELSSLGEIWGAADSTRLERRSLTADGLQALRLGEFGTLHFATHAVASSLDPRRCAVILSGGERLSLRDVAAMRLGPSLVVLSACQTGEGEVIPGEGVVGLSWAFLRAGARGVTASLWAVEDASTAELMARMHEGLRDGEDPVRALAEAQRQVAKSRPHPAYWAPFVVVLSPGSS